MLRLGLATALVAAMGATAPAWAQQDPEPETETEQEEIITTYEVAPQAKEDEDISPKPQWDTLLVGRVSAGAGALGGGDTINPGAGAMSVVGADLTPKLLRGGLELSAPLTYNYRQTFATSLTDMHGKGGAKVLYRFNRRVRASAELGLAATWKPDWVDPFQPLMDGGFGTTDRYSHWDRRASVDVDVRPARHQRVHVGYDYVLSVYKHDPQFDPIYQPLHLTPWDRDMHRLDAEWRVRRVFTTFRVGVELARWQYFFTFAGDAKTGITHTSTGGEPPNPLLELRSLKPRIESNFAVTDRVALRARYELEVMQDPFQGYLSYTGQHPSLTMSAQLPHMIELGARADYYHRNYGRNSYNYIEDPMDPTHPPLAYGDRRVEDRVYVTADARMPLSLKWSPHWAVLAEARIGSRRTNYTYGDIEWGYFNWLAWTGAEYRY